MIEDPLSYEKIRAALGNKTLHIREPQAPYTDSLDSALDEMQRILFAYEEALRVDANYYQDRPDRLVLVSRKGLLQKGPINHFQFIVPEDEYTVWGVEMDLEEKLKPFWFAKRAIYVNCSNALIERMGEIWVSKDAFLYPNVSDYYNKNLLKEGIRSITSLSMPEGRITSVFHQYKDAFAINGTVSIDVNHLATLPAGQRSMTKLLIATILDQLPIDVVKSIV